PRRRRQHSARDRHRGRHGRRRDRARLGLGAIAPALDVGRGRARGGEPDRLGLPIRGRTGHGARLPGNGDPATNARGGRMIERVILTAVIVLGIAALVTMLAAFGLMVAWLVYGSGG